MADAKRHARLGPSSSDIWLTCLGAPAEWAKYPPKVVGFAAKEGTLAHALCEAALKLNAVRLAQKGEGSKKILDLLPAFKDTTGLAFVMNAEDKHRAALYDLVQAATLPVV